MAFVQGMNFDQGENRISFRPPVKMYTTQNYFDVLQEADKSRFSGGLGSDGEVSRQELQEYRDNLRQVSQWVDVLGQIFGPIFGKTLWDNLTRSLREKRDVATIMMNNFERFSNPDNAMFFRAPGITRQTIQKVAGSDGRPETISDQDVRQPFVFAPPPQRSTPPFSPFGVPFSSANYG